VSLGAPPMRDRDLLAWCEELIGAVLDGLPAGEVSPAGAAPGSVAPDADGDGQATRERQV
jgi:hypothetical protein